MKKTILYTLIVFAVWFSNITVNAQQNPQYTQYMFSQLSYNPAYAGSKTGINLEGLLRAQWVGIEGAPLSQSLGIHLPVPYLKSGIGLSINNDLLGAYRYTNVYLNYAYRLKVGNLSTLALGINIGGLQQGLQGDKLVTPTGDYNDGVSHNDVLLNEVKPQSSIAPDAGLGIQLETQQFFISISALHLLEPTLSFQNSTDEVQITQKRHFYAHLAYKFALTNNIYVNPSVLLKSDLNRHQVEATALFNYNENIHFGVGFRGYEPNSFDAVSLIAGMKISPVLMLSYAYDLGISGLRNYQSGSHELVIHYNLNNVLPTQKGKTRYNPRYL